MSENRLAFVFYATDEPYAVAVMVFVHLLRQLGMRPDADVIVLHRPLAAWITDKLNEMGITTRLVEPVRKLIHRYYRHCLVKLRIFELTEYERVLYVDADAIPLNSLDYLLSQPITAPVAAPRAYWLRQPQWTSALLVAQPSMANWNRVKRHFGSAARRWSVFDMQILNREFAHEIQSLPPTAFCLNSEWEDARRPGYFADPAKAYASVSVVHFTALGKPWIYSTAEARRRRPNANPLFYEMWEKWRATRHMILRDKESGIRANSG